MQDLKFLENRLISEEKQKPQNERSELTLIEKLKFVIENDFKIITYTEAFEILRNLLIKTGGDSKKEIVKNFNSISKLNVDDFDMDNQTWKMNYETE